ncbi:MAG: 16S rRNA (cytidine(1402)-2'-O)-methyltransferase [bacterium]
MNSKIYIVSTPIGNLGDITLRAIDVLKQVDLVLCEDTRIAKKLLNHYKITTPTLSYHQYSDTKKIRQIEKMLQNGKVLALITDAGTPGISDPGNFLISNLVLRLSHSLDIIPIPGASSVTAALSISGFDCDKFIFLGFPPHKKRRKTFFAELAKNRHTTIFFESNHRIRKAMQEMRNNLNADTKIVICRELTKKFESVYRGKIKDFDKMDMSERGEYVIVVDSSHP